jgi:segregation and condensation protein A
VSPSPLNVHLDQYEGPLDLLLDLIRKQQINIYDIPISRITAQYLEFMERAAELNVELSSEFVYMAATLIHIKSKMLLPRDPELDHGTPEDDPRQELVTQLLEHERFKQAAEMLHQKRVIEEATWSNPPVKEFTAAEEEQPGLSVSLFDLVKVFQGVLERAKAKPVYEIGKEEVTVPQMIQYLRDLFRAQPDRPQSATELLEKQASRRGVICLFLAILELVKRQAVELTQSEMFGDIGLKPREEMDAAFATEDAVAAVEEEYK